MSGARPHSEVHEDREKVRAYLVDLASKGGGWLKAKELKELGVSPKIAGSAIKWFYGHPDHRFRVEKWGYAHATTWRVLPVLSVPGPIAVSAQGPDTCPF